MKTTKHASKTKSVPKPPAIKSDQQWRAESDARTLMEAEQIKADRTRLGAAKKHAQKLANDATKVGKI